MPTAAGAFPNGFPRRGEIYTVDFGEPRGSAQAYKRPAVVISSDIGNQHSPVVVVAAMTSSQVERRKGRPTTVFVPAAQLDRDGVILCNQLQTIDKDDLLSHRATLTSEQVDELNEALIRTMGIPKRLAVRPTPSSDG